jgi:type I restriction enzyme M protein
VVKEVQDVAYFYGQERIRTTYNLVRMNMILHDVHYYKFGIKKDYTLEKNKKKIKVLLEVQIQLRSK